MQSFEWRKNVKADRILEDWEPAEVLRKFFAGGICGHDKESCPVYITSPALIDMKGRQVATEINAL